MPTSINNLKQFSQGILTYDDSGNSIHVNDNYVDKYIENNFIKYINENDDTVVTTKGELNELLTNMINDILAQHGTSLYKTTINNIETFVKNSEKQLVNEFNEILDDRLNKIELDMYTTLLDLDIKESLLNRFKETDHGLKVGIAQDSSNLNKRISADDPTNYNRLPF